MKKPPEWKDEKGNQRYAEDIPKEEYMHLPILHWPPSRNPIELTLSDYPKNPNAKSILDIVDEATKDITEEEWDAMDRPKDVDRHVDTLAGSK